MKPPKIYTEEELEAELNRRFEEVENGTAKLYTVEEVFAQLEKKYKDKRDKLQKKKKS